MISPTHKRGARQSAASRTDDDYRPHCLTNEPRCSAFRHTSARRAAAPAHSWIEPHELEPLEQPGARLVVYEARGVKITCAVEGTTRCALLGQRIIEA